MRIVREHARQSLDYLRKINVYVPSGGEDRMAYESVKRFLELVESVTPPEAKKKNFSFKRPAAKPAKAKKKARAK